jgi:hypothetical protein
VYHRIGVTKGKGYVIILEGRDSWGWRGFSQVLAGLLGSNMEGKKPLKTNVGHRTRQAILMRGSQTFKDIVNHGVTAPKIILVSVENINTVRDTGLPGAQVDFELSLKLDLGIGPSGDWVMRKEILSPN